MGNSPSGGNHRALAYLSSERETGHRQDPIALDTEAVVERFEDMTSPSSQKQTPVAEKETNKRSNSSQFLPGNIGDIDKNEANYTELQRIGRGTMASVFLLEHKTTKKKFTRKEYLLECLEERNKQMMHLAVELKHPHIVTYYWVKQQVLHFKVFMEYCEGGSLKGLIEEQHEKKTLFQETVLCRFLGYMASGLQFLHEKHIAHRNVRPSNVLLTANRNSVKIADCGEGSVLITNDLPQRGVGGRLQYMAPEMIVELPHSYPVDVWALGIIMHEMATFELPKGKTAPALEIDDSFNPLNDHYSEQLRKLVKDMLCTPVSKRVKCDEILRNSIIFDILTKR